MQGSMFYEKRFSSKSGGFCEILIGFVLAGASLSAILAQCGDSLSILYGPSPETRRAMLRGRQNDGIGLRMFVVNWIKEQKAVFV
jgi:hypothetical protein